MQSRPISNEQWKRVQEVFWAAAELPPEQQAAMVAAVTATDPAVGAEVESLLRADRAGADEDLPVAAAIGSEVQELLNDSRILGARLGDYRVIREIGHGGMGAVYLAERDDQHYRKQVAIKVVKRGMDTAEVLGRFRYERQILANLDHPYVARLIDGGSTSDGRPFFVMDYVQGQPIDQYCRGQNLDVAARLQLFLRVCEAVAEAHRHLIVHRDLKPGNILVTPEGIPKLLDFGVARLLDPALDPASPATSAAAGRFTPEYASPEQVRGMAATTTTDVYSLGAVLYELLTEVRAQAVTDRSVAEMDRVVCQTDAARPSTVAPRRLRRQLAGDLDNIVRMAMRKEKERRYQSVDGLAEDIRRHLTGLPVVARGDSVGYRTWKYARRHRWFLAAASLIAASLIAGATIARSQAKQAQAARQVAEAHRQTAERERARAESEALAAKTERDRSELRLTEMVALADRSLFDIHTAIERLPGATAARQRIVASTLQFLENLSHDAASDDRLKFLLSVAYLKVGDIQGYPTRPNLGDRPAALASYRKAQEWLAPLLAKDPENLQFRQQSVHLWTQIAVVQQWENQTAPAVQALRAVLPEAQRLGRLRPLDTDYRTLESDIYSGLAIAYASTDPALSLEYSKKQVEVMSAVVRDLPGNRAAKLELAVAYSQLGQGLHYRPGLSYTEPMEPYRRSIALREEAVAADPTDTIARRGLMISYANLAAVLYNDTMPSAGDVAGATEYYSKAVAIARSLAAADPNDQLAQYDLANALLRYGWMEPAPAGREASLAALQQSEAIFLRSLTADPKSIRIVTSLTAAQEYVGQRLREMGRVPEAVAAYRRCLDLTERFLASNPKNTGLVAQDLFAQNGLALTLAGQGNRSAVEAAQRSIRLAREWLANAPDPERAHSLLAAAFSNLGAVQWTLGDCTAARAAAAQALAEWKALADAGGKDSMQQDHLRAEELLRNCVAAR